MAFSSLDDLMKNMHKAIANMSGVMGGDSGLTDEPTMKTSIREYQTILELKLETRLR
jgi:hypothetical protein